ncbi:hypothetical protein GCM10011504_33500 [Siccirubricoccus deserti]|uniref:Energy transducer TonB n=1 Tax=Siccirubricoccus deserti TaxID=2013562 RepID=A0A9X0QZF2_9PROT|nr:energy transducer TonB [Siccirubricoccus deserti]MBC4016844.1 energy transducer TonB [Siccirubricoccus deserti]GGC52365.1 hypothetical protein GCM10011504_33500 [Siccirubricoccus deserti]
MAGLIADPALRPRDRGRRGGWRRDRWRRRAPVAASVLLHLGFFALVMLALLTREKPPEPLPPPAYAVYYQSGAPDRPGEPEAEAQAERTAPPPEPPSVAAPPAPPPLPDLPVPETPRPPTAPPLLAEPAPPMPPPAQPETAAPPPAPPRPDPQVAVLPPRPVPAPLPLPPPPPAPPREVPRGEAAPAPQRLPGLYLPEALALTRPQTRPAPSRPEAPRRRLDLALGPLPPPGRFSVEPETDVRGAKVGPDWRNAFRRWLEENKRYPENARVVGEQGTNRVELQVAPDGRVRSARLVRQSGSVWLDAGTLSLFRGANLPPFPAGADPGGVTVDLTIHYILIR